MFRTYGWIPVLMLSGSALFAQTVVRPSVQASGSATLMAKPDQATLDVGVVTNGTTAQDAAQQNATLTTAVQAAIGKVLGPSGTMQTVNYSVYPRYSNNVGQPSTIIGYTATNTVRVTMNDLSIIGQLIDTGNAAGANSVGNLSFGLQNPEPYTQQALTQATKIASGHAAAIAAGLGGRLGAVISAQEGSSYTPVVIGPVAGAGATTPVQTGTVNIYATVTVQVALAQ